MTDFTPLDSATDALAKPNRALIERLTEVSRERALTARESIALERALDCESQRQRRLPARIVRMRAEIHKLESELWPQAAEQLGRLQQLADDQRRVDLEKEFRFEA